MTGRNSIATKWPLARVLAAGTLVALIGLVPGTHAQAVELERCNLTTPDGRLSATAHCGQLTVAENPQDADAGEITLRLAVRRARNGETDRTPLYFLAGGPGQSAIDTLPLQARLLSELNRNRDLVFVDQRGSGGSAPLVCDFSRINILAPASIEVVREAYRECRDTLDIPLAQYTTRNTVHDLEQVRQALGHNRINLLGVSYGTRVAQVYLRNHPQQVRSLILDGVVPMNLALGSEHGRMLDRALQALAQQCRDHDDCHQHFPEFGPQLELLATRFPLGGPGQKVRTQHPVTNAPVTLAVNRELVAQVVRLLSYQPETQALLPWLVDDAFEHDDFSRFAQQWLLLAPQLEEQIYAGLEASVGCAEDWPRWQSQPAEAEAETLLGPAMRQFREAICSVWPSDAVGEAFYQPVTGDTPTLLLSGSLDPVTPPRYAKAVARHLERSRHLVVRGMAHGTLRPPCVTGIAAAFLENLQPDQLDTDCLTRQQPMPAFRSSLGPAP